MVGALAFTTFHLSVSVLDVGVRLKSRHQRIHFTLETEKGRVRNLEAFLLQTSMRDTGEILNDLALPIQVQGRHWGALVMGFNPERFIKG